MLSRVFPRRRGGKYKYGRIEPSVPADQAITTWHLYTAEVSSPCLSSFFCVVIYDADQFFIFFSAALSVG